MQAVAPGRVNLIGEHTDHAGGLALPMAIGLATTVVGDPTPGDEVVRLRSTAAPQPAIVPLVNARDIARDGQTPPWIRLVAAVIDAARPTVGFAGEVRSTLPLGAGLSSSASLAVAVALALGHGGSPRSLAELARQAEQTATGVPCGLMDQLAITSATAGNALLIDFSTGTLDPIPVPDSFDVVIVDSGERRSLAATSYGERQAQCVAAAELIGSLHDATIDDVERITDPVVRRRARHVVTENERVRRFATALRADDRATAGALMDQSHASLRDDFEVSTPGLDALVERLRGTDGVHGCRLTGAGFGGCVVALCEPGSLSGSGEAGPERQVWVVRPAAGARAVR